MIDPWDTVPVVAKGRRICASPLCSKLLSTMNNQPFCFASHDAALLERVTGRLLPRGAAPPTYRPK